MKDFDEFVDEKKITNSVTWPELVDDIMDSIDDVVPDQNEYDQSDDKFDYIWNSIDSVMCSKWTREQNDVFEEWAYEIVDEVMNRIGIR